MCCREMNPTDPNITRPLHPPPKAFLSKVPPSSNPGSSPAETQDLSQQSCGATAILWKAPEHWSWHGTATHCNGHCLAWGLAPSGSSVSWGDMTHTKILPDVQSIMLKHSWDPSRNTLQRKGSLLPTSHKTGMREKQAKKEF